ncbi:M56 family metallopeptidase [Lutispora thermophila]|uniref:Signal transducer regulating beta-lactamase production, contains metallopeptidase domain n=1 Tax=Lutispora thermophila DSM 19022 TaxID=1122184 RepID=A0A1M6IHV0_9FIRM|nr:M56 family metallopeptidase [Lutispora thermophila]SHJ34022.1 Signal transducer regulating beta-lactamase production, contains metallopeptidase domain [Lutispora thermophila DSM 19022]
MLANLYNHLFVMSVVAGGLYLILKLFGRITMKHFMPSWHYYTYTAIYMFFLLPYHKLLSLFNFDFNRNVKNGLVLPVLSSNLELRYLANNGLVGVPDKIESSFMLNIDFLAYILLAGTLVFIVAVLIQNVKFRRRIFSVCRLTDKAQFQDILSSCKQEMGISKEVLVYISIYPCTPFLYGVLKPRIILPDIEFTEEELKHVFYHELTHLKRYDPWIKFLLLLTNAVHWFNPLAYIIRNDIDGLCELSCDESVVISMNAAERRRYCEIILSVLWHSIGHDAKLVSAFSNKRKQLERRMDMIMKMRGLKYKKRVILFSMVVTLTIVSLGIITAYASTSNKADLTSPSEGRKLINGAELIDADNKSLIGTEIIDAALPFISKSSPKISDSEKTIDFYMPENTIIKKLADNTVLPPISITNFEVIDNITPEIIMTNGSAAFFTKKGGSGWSCKVGDKLVYEFEKYESNVVSSQTMIIGYVLDGTLYPGEEFKGLSGKYELKIEEDGDYYIYVINATSDYLALKKGKINILRQ